MDNILKTITAYREERNWSLYDLATHAEMKSTTISTWYNNNATPSIPSLVKICDAFQITLSEFFAKAEGSESAPVVLTSQQMQFMEKWSVLRLLNSGEIPAFKMGKPWKVYKQDLIQYMSQCQ